MACLELGISSSFVPGFPSIHCRIRPARIVSFLTASLSDLGDQLGRQTQLGDGIGARPFGAAKSDCCRLWWDRSVALWLRQSRASTADMTRGLLEAMAAEGIVLGDRSDPSAFVSVLRGLLHECVVEQREHEGRAAIGRGDAACDCVTVHQRHRLCVGLIGPSAA